jgi:hypothetical protein
MEQDASGISGSDGIVLLIGKRAARPRILVGITIALFIHQTIYLLGSIATACYERMFRLPVIFSLNDRFSWLLLCAGVGCIFWCYKRPRVLEWGPPFAVFIGYWLLSGLVSALLPDSSRNIEWQWFNLAMFLTCLSVLAFPLLLSVCRFGYRNRQKIRQAIGYDAAVHVDGATPQDVLVRASIPPEPSGDILLRSAKQDTPTATQELLRPDNISK